MVHHLVSGNRFVVIAVCERERGIVRRRRRVRTRIEKDRHVLQRAWARAVEREVGLVLGYVLVIGLPDAEGKRRVGVLLVEVVTEIDRNLPGPEEVVRGRKCRDRSASTALSDDDASRCGQGDFIV